MVFHAQHFLGGLKLVGSEVFGGQVILAMVGQMNADVTNCQGGVGGGLAVPIVRPAGNKSPALISPHN